MAISPEFKRGFSQTLKRAKGALYIGVLLGSAIVIGAVTLGTATITAATALGIIACASSAGLIVAGSYSAFESVGRFFKSIGDFFSGDIRATPAYSKGALAASLALATVGAAGYMATNDTVNKISQQSSERNAIKGIMNARFACESGEAYIEIQKDPATMKLANATIICQPKQ